MKRVRLEGPGLYALMDGARRVGVWQRIGKDEQNTSTINYKSSDDLKSKKWCAFDTLPADFQSQVSALVDQILPAMPRGEPVALLVLEWSRALLVRGDLGADLDAHPQACSGMAVCRLKVLRDPSYVVDGDRLVEVRQIPASELMVDPASAVSWLEAALHADPGRPSPPPVRPVAPLPLPDTEGEPGGALSLPLDSTLDRQLRVVPRRRWAPIYQSTQPSSVALTLGLRTQIALLAFGLIALILSLILSFRPESAREAGARARLTELRARQMGSCDARSARFLRELRCQVTQLDQGGLRPDCAPPEGAWEEEDLQPELCGLLDWSQDNMSLPPLTAAQGALSRLPVSALPARAVPLDPGELALSQACFRTLGSPPSYAMADPEGGTLDGAWGDPERLLRGPDALAPLARLANDLRESCDTQRERLRLRVEGAQLAALIGAPAPDEPRALRDAAAAALTAEQSEADGACLTEGVERGVNASSYRDLCPASGAADPSSTSLVLLGGTAPAPVAGEAKSVVDRYLDARFGTPMAADPVAADPEPIWRCHEELSASTSAAPQNRPGAWMAPVPLPRGYAPGNGVQSELLLNAALLGQGEGQDLGTCWSAMADLLAGWTSIHPLLMPVDPKGRLSDAQQVCGQVCSVGFRVGASDKSRLTPGGDLAACVDASQTPQAGFARLVLPWSGQTGAVPPATSPGRWIAPSASQICAFNLLAQGSLDLGRKGWMPEGLVGATWAGEGPDGVSGGTEGEAYRAATRFSGEQSQPRSGERECGAVALQCFTAVALEVAQGGARSGWQRRWGDAIVRLSRQEAAITAEANPWCGLIYPYLAPKIVTEQLDATCRTGVELARFGVSDALTALQEAP